MTALKGRDIEAFVNKRAKDVAAVLIYGPDEGLVRERGDKLAASVVADLKDPFNVIELADADLKATPSILSDEISALSFAGGERVIRLRTSGDAAAGASALLIKGLVEGYVAANGLVVIEAGDLAKSSKLRKTFEGAKKRAVALPCYSDGPAEVKALAVSLARDATLRFSNDALAYLVAQLGEDRALSRAEIEKLILYMGSSDDAAGEITLDDVRAVIVDTVADATFAVADAVADGDMKLVSNTLHRSSSAGVSPISILMALNRQFARLGVAAHHVARGESASEAMKKLRPPVFFMEQRAFERRLHRWSAAKVEKAQEMLLETELAAKTASAPQQELIERTAFRLAALAARR
jgi:DNA polymerase-3 subunit delta